MARLFDDGSSEYLEVASALLSGAPLSMAGWFYSDDLTILQSILCIADASANTFIYLGLNGNQAGDPVEFQTREAGGSATARTTAGYSANTWHHAAGVTSASNSRSAWIDGGSIDTDGGDVTPTGLDVSSIGRRADVSPGQHMSGRIAEVGLWNAALTVAEVGILAKGYSPLFVRPQSLVAYWPLIRDEDQDRVGGYDLGAFNTPSIAAHPPIIYPAPPILVTIIAAAVAGAMPMAMHHYRLRRA